MQTNDNMEQALLKAIRKELEDTINKEIENASKELEKKLRSRVGEIVCCVLNHMTFERYGSQLKITVDFNNK